MQSRLRFLGQWVRNPREIGSITPSSRFLTREVVERIDPSRARYIVELGPGTGVFTQALLDALPAEGRILAVDTNASFIEHLKKELRDPRLEARLGRARRRPDRRGWLAPRRRRRLRHPVFAAASPRHAEHLASVAAGPARE